MNGEDSKVKSDVDSNKPPDVVAGAISNTDCQMDDSGDSGVVNNETKIEKSNEEMLNETDKTQKRRKKHTRRGSKKNKPRKPRHKFKPYNTLTWDEKRKLGEHDALRAMQRRKELSLQKGCPIAPYNTTQFLMEEHKVLENFDEKVLSNSYSKPDYTSAESNTDNPCTLDTSSSSISDDEYFDKDFDEFYTRVHIDTLNSFSKDDLISYISELEVKIENLEKYVRINQVLADQNAKLAEEIQELKGNMDRKV